MSLEDVAHPAKATQGTMANETIFFIDWFKRHSLYEDHTLDSFAAPVREGWKTATFRAARLTR